MNSARYLKGGKGYGQQINLFVDAPLTTNRLDSTPQLRDLLTTFFLALYQRVITDFQRLWSCLFSRFRTPTKNEKFLKKKENDIKNGNDRNNS